MESEPDIRYLVSPNVSNDELNALFRAAREAHADRDFGAVLGRSLGYVCGFQGERLVGFVNVAWDGGLHAFLLDATVHPDVRRQGIGRPLVAAAVDLARAAGVEWVHADLEPELRDFYAACGFRPTEASLIHLVDDG